MLTSCCARCRRCCSSVACEGQQGRAVGLAAVLSALRAAAAASAMCLACCCCRWVVVGLAGLRLASQAHRCGSGWQRVGWGWQRVCTTMRLHGQKRTCATATFPCQWANAKVNPFDEKTDQQNLEGFREGYNLKNSNAGIYAFLLIFHKTCRLASFFPHLPPARSASAANSRHTASWNRF